MLNGEITMVLEKISPMKLHIKEDKACYPLLAMEHELWREVKERGDENDFEWGLSPVELYVKRKLEKEGYTVERGENESGEPDFICQRPSEEPIYVEVKSKDDTIRGTQIEWYTKNLTKQIIIWFVKDAPLNNFLIEFTEKEKELINKYLNTPSLKKKEPKSLEDINIVGGKLRQEQSKKLRFIIEELVNKNPDGEAKISDIIKRAITEGMDEKTASDVIDWIAKQGLLWKPKPDIVKLVR